MINIFIRTYKNDLPWLQYCLRSIHKYVTGYDKIIVCIPENQVSLLNDFNLPKVIACPIYKDDYLGQQISKLNADIYCESEYVLYVDSDCVFTKPFDCNSLFFNGKPIVYKTHYDKVGDAICWKEITEKTLNRPVEWEFMRRLPLLYKSETIKDLREYIELIHGKDLETYVVSQPNRHYSEFNSLGAFAYFFCNEEYHFHDTDYGIDENCLVQHFSWGGITAEIREKIEGYLK